MMKLTYLTLPLFLLFTACGSSGSCSSNTIATTPTSDVQENNHSESKQTYTVLAERGPVFLAKVYDAKGLQSTNANLGYSNIYHFEKRPIFPIRLEGGVIDLNRDNKIDGSDMKLDINMSSYSKVISPLTTMIEGNQSRIKYLNNYLSITKEEIEDRVPSLSSDNAVILSNACYKAIRLNYSFGSEEFNETVDEVKRIYQENFLTLKDTKRLALLLEKKVLESFETPVKDSVEVVSNDVSSGVELDNDNFIYSYSISDSIETIWSIPIGIKPKVTASDVAIAVSFAKEGSGSNGTVLILGVNISNGIVTHIGSVAMIGESSTSSKGSVAYGERHHITQNALSIVQGETLLINMGYIINNQDIVSPSSFKKVSRTDVAIYVSNIDIGGSRVGEMTIESDADEGLYHFPNRTESISGVIEIKEKRK